MSASKLDLDIEFEDEDESKRLEEERKKREEVKDVDLQFSMDDEDDASEEQGATGVALKKAQAEARRAAIEKKQAAQGQNVADIGEARKARDPVVQNTPAQHNVTPEPTIRPQPNSIPTQAPAPIRPSASSPHYRLGDELNYAMEVNTLLSAEVQARVQLAVAQAQTEIIARAAQEAKLLEHKVVKLLTQINAKAPAAKAELMAIKKMLAENTDPKKLFEESVPASEKAEAPKKKVSGS